MERSTEWVASVAFEGYAAGEALKSEDVDRYLRSYPYVIRRVDGSEATDAERLEAVRRNPLRARMLDRKTARDAPGAEAPGCGDGNEAPLGLTADGDDAADAADAASTAADGSDG